METLIMLGLVIAYGLFLALVWWIFGKILKKPQTVLTVPGHNLIEGQIIYMHGAQYRVIEIIDGNTIIAECR